MFLEGFIPFDPKIKPQKTPKAKAVGVCKNRLID